MSLFYLIKRLNNILGKIQVFKRLIELKVLWSVIWDYFYLRFGFIFIKNLYLLNCPFRFVVLILLRMQI